MLQFDVLISFKIEIVKPKLNLELDLSPSSLILT